MNQAYFVIIAIALSIFGSIYTYLSYRNKERMALIDSGFSPDSFKTLDARRKTILIVGLVFVGFSVGIIAGFFFEKYLLLNFNPNDYRNYPQAYLTMVPLCVGIAVLIAYFSNRKAG